LGLLDEAATASLMSFSCWSIILEVLRSNLDTSVTWDGSHIEFLRNKRCDGLVLRRGFARMKHVRREELKISLLDFFFCFRVFLLVFLDSHLRFRC
jgi:hypothetical protein